MSSPNGDDIPIADMRVTVSKHGDDLNKISITFYNNNQSSFPNIDKCVKSIISKIIEGVREHDSAGVTMVQINSEPSNQSDNMGASSNELSLRNTANTKSNSSQERNQEREQAKEAEYDNFVLTKWPAISQRLQREINGELQKYTLRTLNLLQRLSLPVTVLDDKSKNIKEVLIVWEVFQTGVLPLCTGFVKTLAGGVDIELPRVAFEIGKLKGVVGEVIEGLDGLVLKDQEACARRGFMRKDLECLLEGFEKLVRIGGQLGQFGGGGVEMGKLI